MTESDNVPDPVVETAPEAPPAPDDRTDELPGDEPEAGAVFPIAGTGAGTVPAPVNPTRPS